MRKKLSALFLGAVLILSTFTSCSENNTQIPPPATSDVVAETTEAEESGSSETAAVVQEVTEGSGETETLFSPDFEIEKLENGIKRVTDGDGRELILVPKALGEIPAEYADSIVITTPVDNAVFLSSTQVCTFRTVNDPAILDGIGAVEGDAETWSDISDIADRIASGDIIDISGDTGIGEPDYEKIQALNPDVVFVYTGEYGQQTTIAKLDELGINYAVDNEYMESSYLARMEWMRFLLTFFDADEAADKVMANVQHGIDTVKAEIAGKDKPVIAVFSVYNGAVSATKDEGWTGSMIADMGGVNAFRGMDASALTMEAAFDVINTADVVIYTAIPSYCNGMAGVIDAFPQITECRAYENDRVYQYSDIFWYGIDQSDIMACDMAAVLYPEVFADRTLSYYIKLEK